MTTYETTMDLRKRITALADELAQDAHNARQTAEAHRSAETTALMADDEASAEEHRAREMVARGEAAAHDAASLRARLLAAGIPEDV